MTTKEYIIDTIQNNKNKISKLGIKDIGLFGSYVRNEQTEKSDIDILIDFFPEKENYDNYLALYVMIEKLFEGGRAMLSAQQAGLQIESLACITKMDDSGLEFQD